MPTYAQFIGLVRSTMPRRYRPTKRAKALLFKHLIAHLLQQVMFNGEDVRWPGFGTFVRAERKARYIAAPPGVSERAAKLGRLVRGYELPAMQSLVLRPAKACRRKKPPPPSHAARAKRTTLDRGET